MGFQSLCKGPSAFEDPLQVHPGKNLLGRWSEEMPVPKDSGMFLGCVTWAPVLEIGENSGPWPHRNS